MFTPMQSYNPQHGREAEFPPLLFSLTNLDQVTPRAQTPGRTTTENSLSWSRGQRSGTTPGSMTHGEINTPGPPLERLAADVVMEELRNTPPGAQNTQQQQQQQQQQQPYGAAYGAYPQQQQVYSSAAQAIADGSSSHAQEYNDVWVTVFGFPQSEFNSVLADFSLCGDILQWSTFGQPAPNHVHLQYQNKYGAQRALLRQGIKLASHTIIGVKPLDPKDRLVMEAQASGAPAPLAQQQPQQQQHNTPARPYRVDMAMMTGQRGAQQQQQAFPQPSRSMFNKAVEFVFGM
ncbi:MAG: hypothetical protein WDW38_006245 [Sanguina aurantia]